MQWTHFPSLNYADFIIIGRYCTYIFVLRREKAGLLTGSKLHILPRSFLQENLVISEFAKEIQTNM